MYIVYILQSGSYNDKFYVGYISNPKKRLIKHNKGDVLSTKKYRPWKVVFYWVFENKKFVLRFESYFKTCSGRAFFEKDYYN